MNLSDSRVTVSTQFSDNITEELQEELKALAHEQAEKFSGSYFQQILKKEDAQISIRFNIEKREADQKYECKFNANLDGTLFPWSNDVPFSVPRDVVMHAYKHLKAYLSDKKE